MANAVRTGWAALAAVLALMSGVALALIASTASIPSAVRHPLWDFVQPGTTLWWLTSGGAFRVAPTSPAEIAFAAVTSAALWLASFWLLLAMYRAARRFIGAGRG